MANGVSKAPGFLSSSRAAVPTARVVLALPPGADSRRRPAPAVTARHTARHTAGRKRVVLPFMCLFKSEATFFPTAGLIGLDLF